MTPSEIRPFVPSKDYEASISFYTSLGFIGEAAGEDLTVFTKNSCTFFLQKYYNEELANNFMLQLVVPDIKEAFDTIAQNCASPARHSEITQEHWGRVIYLWGPSGELWHVTELNS